MGALGIYKKRNRFFRTSRARNALSVVTVQQRCASAAEFLHKTDSSTRSAAQRKRQNLEEQAFVRPNRKLRFHRPIIDGLDVSCLDEVVGPGCDAAAQVVEGQWRVSGSARTLKGPPSEGCLRGDVLDLTTAEVWPAITYRSCDGLRYKEITIDLPVDQKNKWKARSNTPKWTA